MEIRIPAPLPSPSGGSLPCCWLSPCIAPFTASREAEGQRHPAAPACHPHDSAEPPLAQLPMHDERQTLAHEF